MDDIQSLKQELQGIISDLSKTAPNVDPELMQRLSEEANNFGWNTTAARKSDPQQQDTARNLSADEKIVDHSSDSVSRASNGRGPSYNSPSVHISRTGSIHITSSKVDPASKNVTTSHAVHPSPHRYIRHTSYMAVEPGLKETPPPRTSSSVGNTVAAASAATAASAKRRADERRQRELEDNIQQQRQLHPRTRQDITGQHHQHSPELRHQPPMELDMSGDTVPTRTQKAAQDGLRKQLRSEQNQVVRLEEELASVQVKKDAEIADLKHRLQRAISANRSVNTTKNSTEQAFSRLAEDKESLAKQLKQKKQELHTLVTGLQAKDEQIKHLSSLLKQEQKDKNDTALQLQHMTQEATQRQREIGDDSTHLLQLQEKCQQQARTIETLREELDSERRKEVEFANRVEMAESDARLSQSRLQAAKSELITVTEDAEAANMLAEGLKQQLEARDAKLNKLNAALVETRLECEEQEQRLSEKDRELLQTKHAFRMHIRRLEADLDTQQDEARRARGEAEQADHIMKKHLTTSSAETVSQIQQEQDLVHRLRDLQNAATEQLKVTEELQKKIVEQENVIKELNEDAETQRQVIHSQEADAAEFQSTIRNYEATKSAQDQLVQRVRSDNERLERQRSELSDKLGQCEVELEQARYREGLLEKELKEQKEACHELQLKQVLALTGSGSSPGQQSANQLVVATSAQASDVNAVTAELEAFKQRYKAAAKSRAECAEEVLALKAELVETQLTVDDLKQKLKAERKLSADQRAKLKENGMTMEELESQARNNAAQLLATIVEKDTLIQQISTALEQSADRQSTLEKELQQARSDAVELAKFYDQKSALADSLQQNIQNTSGRSSRDENQQPAPSGATVQKLLSLRARIEGFLSVEAALRRKLNQLEVAIERRPAAALSHDITELQRKNSELEQELQETQESRNKISVALLSVLKAANIDHEAAGINFPIVMNPP